MNYRHYQQARDMAWEIIIQEHITELPIKTSALCRSMGIALKEYVPSDDNDGEGQFVGGVPTIRVSGNASVCRKRFTVAHEIGHFLLGHVGEYELVNREPGANDDPIEQAANVFASRLLAPACVLWGCHVKTADDIMRLCDISRQAAEYRLKRMQELYRREKEFLATRGRSCFLMSSKERAVFNQFKDFIDRNKL